MKMISQIQLHKSVKHKSICQLQRAFQDEENVYMLLQLCSNGVNIALTKNMFDLIKKRKKLTIAETQYFIYQLIDGLCYLHNKQIIHREYVLAYLASNWAIFSSIIRWNLNQLILDLLLSWSFRVIGNILSVELLITLLPRSFFRVWDLAFLVILMKLTFGVLELSCI